MTFFDVRIPGLAMTLVQADGQNVQPVTVDEFRIGPGETYDMIVEPRENAYTIFAESMDRSGYALGTLAAEEGLRAPVPARRKRPVRDMADMGMAMAEHDSEHGAKEPVATGPKGMQEHGASSGHVGAGRAVAATPDQIPWTLPVEHGPDHHGAGNSAVAELSRSRLAEPGIGLGDSGRRVLLYTDLKSLTPGTDRRTPAREVELHLTGNMERYMWSFDGKKYSEAKEPIPFRYGERLRLTLVNDTMMEHPMHLHGMWMELENGAGEFKPRKHTIVIKPAERWSVAITADAPGRWAFHCHLLLHMEMGMFRVVEVSGAPRGKTA
jgi:CopA family copper-resistance protein